MKTPYDTALRSLGREVDEMRTAVQGAADRLSDAQGRRRAVSDAIARESAMAALHSAFPAHFYLKRAGAERDALTELCAQAEAALDALRDRARESYGSLRVMESAAESFRHEAGQAAASAEQARIDDFAGARFARDTRPLRRASRAA